MWCSYSPTLNLNYMFSSETGRPASVHQDGLEELPQLPPHTHGDVLVILLLRRQL